MLTESEAEIAKSICGTEQTLQQTEPPAHKDMTLYLSPGNIGFAEAELDKLRGTCRES